MRNFGSEAVDRRFPLWFKLAWTVLTVVVFSGYSAYYSFAHCFLWFSSVGLLLTCVALWTGSPLLASMQAVGLVCLEFAYTLDLLVRAIAGVFLTGLSVYFFQSQDSPFWVRCLSLFHVPLPFVLLWMLSRIGYDRRALAAQTVLCWTLLLVCYFFTDPRDNVNWVFGPAHFNPHWMPRWGWLAALMLCVPLFIYIPSHLLFGRLFTKRPAGPAG